MGFNPDYKHIKDTTEWKIANCKFKNTNLTHRQTCKIASMLAAFTRVKGEG